MGLGGEASGGAKEKGWGKGVLRLMGSLDAEGLSGWDWGRSGVESMASFFLAGLGLGLGGRWWC